jgi:hypothetical protein
MKPKKEKIPFKDRKIVQWAKENAPGIIGNTLDFVGDVTGISVLEKLGEKIAGSSELTPEQKEEAAKILEMDLELAKLEFEHEKEITARWKSDMESDSWLSKNSRPLVLLSTILFLFVIMILDSVGINFEVKDSWISLYELLLITVVAGYFSARTIEKYKRR